MIVLKKGSKLCLFHVFCSFLESLTINYSPKTNQFFLEQDLTFYNKREISVSSPFWVIEGINLFVCSQKVFYGISLRKYIRFQFFFLQNDWNPNYKLYAWTLPTKFTYKDRKMKKCVFFARVKSIYSPMWNMAWIWKIHLCTFL